MYKPAFFCFVTVLCIFTGEMLIVYFQGIIDCLTLFLAWHGGCRDVLVLTNIKFILRARRILLHVSILVYVLSYGDQ